MGKKFLLLFFLFFSFSPLFAEDEPISANHQVVQWWIDKPISDIKFVGLKNIHETALLPFKKKYIGSTFTDALYLEIYNELTKLDYFERFEVYPIDPTNPGNIELAGTKQNVVLNFMVYENPILDNIIIEGNKNVRKSDILAELVSVIGDPFKRSHLRVDKKAIQIFYTNKGYPNTQVNSRYDIDEDSGKVVIFFEIIEGVKRVVTNISFSGNRVVSNLKLKSTIKTKVQSVAVDGIFDEETVKADMEAITNLYKERGYIKASVTDVKKIPTNNIEKNQEEYALLFEIEEGDCFYFGGIDIYGNTIFDTKRLKSVIGLKPGATLNEPLLEQSIAFLQQIYYADGYVYTEFRPTKIENEDPHIVSYKLEIIERPRAHIENIIIEGLTKTDEEIVRRELPFKEGDVFSNSRLMQGLRSLMQLGYFASVDRRIELGSAPLLMNLIIVVEEGRTTNVQFGVNFSQSIYDEIPIQLFVQLSEQNLGGKGHALNVGTEINANTQRISVSYRDRWIKDKRVGIGASIGFEHNKRSLVYQDLASPVGTNLPDPYEGNYYFSKDCIVNGKQYKKGDIVDWPLISKQEIDEYKLVTDYDYQSRILNETVSSDFMMQYSRFAFFSSVDAGYSWNTVAGLVSIGSGITFNLEKNSYDSKTFRPIEPWLQENNSKWVWTNQWTTRFSLDSRNHNLHPTDGLLLKQVFNYTGGILLGSTHYNKSRTTLEYYKTLFDLPVSPNWHYKTVFAMHSSLHLFLDQFFIQKDGSGKLGTTVGTRDRVEDKLYTDRMNIMRGWDSYTNLEAIWENWFELRMPLYERFLWADMFFEMTGIWNDISSMRYNSSYPKETAADHFFFTLGAGFRLTLDGFPLAIYLTKGFQVAYNNHSPYTDWQTGTINPSGREHRGVNFVFRMMHSF